jgi:CheY-like chemotaxis protein
MEQKKILWVEDGARFELAFLTAPIYYKGIHDLTIAEDVSSAINYCSFQEFDAIILDLRLPPGGKRDWYSLFKKFGEDKLAAKLGVHFLHSILGVPPIKIKIKTIPEWIQPNRIGVFTVEKFDENKTEMNKLNINNFQQKSTKMTNSILLDFIEEVLGS